MKNVGGTSFTSLRLIIGTTSPSASYVIESIDGVIQQGTVSLNSPTTVDISSDFQIVGSDFENREKGIHIYTTNDEEIFVIGENFIQPFNHGVFLAYPCLTFETENGFEYFVISTEATGTLASQVVVVGCENETKVQVMPTQLISLPTNLQEASSTSASIEAGMTSSELTLNQMQTLLVSSTDDLTGTKIVSNKPLTVIAGHECASVPFFSTGCEPIAYQIPPSLTWGTSFLIGAFDGRDPEAGSVFRLLTTEETPIIITCGNSEPTGIPSVTSVFEFSTNQYCFLRSSKPILVVQLSVSGSIDNRGDPAAALVSPIDQYVNKVSFVSLQTSVFPTNYITVTVPAQHFNPSSILLDGNVLDCTWTAIRNDSDLNQTVGYGCSKSVTSGASSPEQHSISHADDDGLLSVLAYGFNERSKTGYAYLAGQQIQVGDGEF